MSSNYTQISKGILDNKKFISLSADGKLMFLIILTHPSMTPLGAMRGGVHSLAGDLGWDPQRSVMALNECVANDLIELSIKPAMIWVPSYLEHNKDIYEELKEGVSIDLDKTKFYLGLLPICELKNKLQAYLYNDEYVEPQIPEYLSIFNSQSMIEIPRIYAGNDTTLMSAEPNDFGSEKEQGSSDVIIKKRKRKKKKK